MAAYRRGLLGTRHAQRMLTSSTGFLHRACGSQLASLDSNVSSSSCYHSLFPPPTSSSSATGFANGTYFSEVRFAREEGWGKRWSRHYLVERSVHTTVSKSDGGDETDGGSRNGKVSSGAGAGGNDVGEERNGAGAKIANEEVREFVQQAHVASLKRKLREDPRDTICLHEFLHLCRTVGMAPSDKDAAAMAHVFNQSGTVFTFRDRVHLHPEKIAKLVANVLPLSVLGEDDQRRMELMELAQKKEEIDRKAHKQMRLVLWSGLFGLTMQVLLFFRLTFWDLSWDVMEPVAFFTTATGLICGYAYFMLTSRDPSYQDFMQRIYQSRQRKLFKKQNFDINRFKELQMQCQAPVPRKKVPFEDDD